MESTNPYSATAQSSPATAPTAYLGVRSLRIKRMDVISAGKVLGAMYVVLGLLFGIIMALATLVGAALGGEANVIGAVVAGLGSVILLPVFYGLLGFIGGVFGAFLYNLVTGMIGGFEFEVEGY